MTTVLLSHYWFDLFIIVQTFLCSQPELIWVIEKNAVDRQ